MARKILLADDSVTAQNMGRKILADAGYEVITVNNGSAALKKINEQKPDVIVPDVYMPGYSGLEVCQRLKEVGETSRIPILLTVGKLEPFKQDEVKRVRADGFIVKPFEASELLSALSKMEDRIVPQSDSSRPGRFARATAALEDNRYDRTVAAEEDNGWKNRISFPSKKKEKEKEEEKEARAEGDDSTLYNPVNKDLRTVVDHGPASGASHGKGDKAEGDRIDLAALSPAGLPKDVTPEEIAALAAAAAQMQAKIAESKGEAPADGQAKKEEADAKPEAVASAVPFIEQKTDQKEKEEERTEAKEISSSASLAEVPATVESQPAQVAAASSGNGASTQTTALESPGDEPVTMAVNSESRAASSRWAAVSVALAPEETGISLEQEMQKAYAAFAAADAGHSAVHSAAHESKPPVVAQAAAAYEAPSPEPVVEIPATPAPSVVEKLSEVANAATEAISAVAKELEAVATSLVAPAGKVSVESASSVASEPAPPSLPEPAIEADETLPTAKDEKEPEALAQEVSPVAQRDEEPADEEPKASPTVEDVPVAVAKEVSTPEFDVSNSPEVAAAATPEPVTETEHKPIQKEREVAKEKETDIAASTAAAWASWHRVRESGSQEAAAKAVAAGAESNPNDVTADGSDAEVANIVDSVLADLRPKIVEEISRKLGKKK